jgi:hypothetical protein
LVPVPESHYARGHTKCGDGIVQFGERLPTFLPHATTATPLGITTAERRSAISYVPSLL